ncbi:PIN domain-containing protein [Actinopolymorpha sp. B17G11]|uniref:PIN domain-containing protein n=1 Tax=unclassified Actinopolymorpha TaxID=2627063 RepID=UPI0032D940E0
MPPLTFVDTNILAYAYDLDEAKKRPIALEALDILWRTKAGVVSTQVLQEFYNTATRRFRQPLSHAAARRVLRGYSGWPVVSPDAALILAASELHERHSVSFWDALIVEAARRAGASRLLTEDLQHGRTFGALTVENPFADASG